MRIHRVNDINYPRRKPTPMPPFRGGIGYIPVLPMAMGMAGGALATCLIIEYLLRLARRAGQ